MRALIRFAIGRPLVTGLLAAGVVSAIFGAGFASGTHIEHLREASKRLALSEKVSACETGRADANATAAQAQANLSKLERQRREEIVRREEERDATLDGILDEVRATADLCRVSGADADWMRDARQRIRAGGSDSPGG